VIKKKAFFFFQGLSGPKAFAFFWAFFFGTPFFGFLRPWKIHFLTQVGGCKEGFKKKDSFKFRFQKPSLKSFHLNNKIAFCSLI